MSIVPFLLASCAAVGPSTNAGARAPASDLLPAPKAALEFPKDANEVQLGWLLDELSRLTGQELTMDAEMRELLDRAAEPLEFKTPVPVNEVYGFVEALLMQHEVFLAHVKGGARPVLAVFGGQSRSVPRSPVVVPDGDIDQLANHPALLCQIVLHFENVDSRQLQTQLRQLLVDQTGMLQVVPCGERSLLLQGPGSYLAGLARLLHDVDRVSAARPAAPVTETREPAAGSAK